MEKQSKYQLSASVNETILEIVITGEVTGDTVEKLQDEVTATIKEKDIKNLLLDICHLEGRLSVESSYWYVRSFLPDRRKMNIAVVDSQDNSDFLVYFGSTAVMAGLSLRCFTDVDDARNWLKSKTQNPAVRPLVKKENALQGIEKEKRHYQRKSLSAPVVINQQQPRRMGMGAITDISLGGVRILIPKDFKQQNLIDSQGSRFETVFNLPNEHKPIRILCESVRVVDAENNTYIGASFVDADFKNHKILQAYLM